MIVVMIDKLHALILQNNNTNSLNDCQWFSLTNHLLSLS
jgi:hypothetical protein